ncbi:TspO/MBR-related protein [Mycena crocata]|nr:TspO/MBR-related protein [Mycena crocata]
MPAFNFHLPDFLLSAARIPVLAVGLPLGLGLLSGYPTAKVVRSDWYKNLRTPPGRPPRQVFPIVWPLLYISMGCASHLAVKTLDSAGSSSVRSDCMLALSLYYAQLTLNLLWTPLFFGAQKTGTALIDSGLMAASTFYMTVSCLFFVNTHVHQQLQKLLATHSSEATYLLLPYCAWLSFATYLNGGIWWLNRDRRDTVQKDE